MKPRRLRVRNTNKPRVLFVQRRSFAFLAFLLVSALAMLISYTVFDNQRLQVDRADISIPTLPKSINGFSILPVADLHGKQFEEGQKGILRVLGAANFDVVLFLGDLVDNDTQDPAPFYELIDALSESKKPMYYTPGNHDPEIWDLSNGDCRPSEFLQGMLDRGVVLLDRPVKLKEGPEGGLWLWPSDKLMTDANAAIETAQANIQRARLRNIPEGDAQAAYNERLLEQYTAVLEAREAILPEDAHIAAGHYPLTPARLALMEDFDGPAPTILDIDLMLAGHYHGGQYRFPPFGALYIPDDDLPRRGWFPAQGSIAGLTRMQGIQQYICRGMGASGPKLLRFRLFNTPEIALLRLTTRVE